MRKRLIDGKPLFGNEFKYLLVLGALAWMSYSLPQVAAAMQTASSYDPGSSSALVTSSLSYPSPTPTPCVTASPSISLASAPTIAKMTTIYDQFGNSTTTYQATFYVSVSAVGGSVTMGLPMSPHPAWSYGASSFGIYKNGALSSMSVQAVAYSQPASTTLSVDGYYFTIPQGKTVVIPVAAIFLVRNAGSNVFAVQMQGAQWTVNPSYASTLDYFMANNTAWRTPAI
ncbi:MAG: hypothetical protein KGI45_01380 [Patescibacteria group bacterium]|nr:hypothetical protein [Patescibacteria group bacterium]